MLAINLQACYNIYMIEKQDIFTGFTVKEFDGDTSVPKLGMPCTYSILGDSYPYIIVGLKGTKNVVVKPIDYNGKMSANAQERYFSKRKNGRWVEKGQKDIYRGGSLSIGRAFARQDQHV